ncbi:hypothetical protein TH25_23750 [Thalassospira profundimaris]|uniref:Uncharacterized protein n=1 Tax=Thalassospira profundimaris TaxID=502049 RepID=A0A367WJ36_9PROT|nr:hypothetical protein [Thalassospira profundimaris]RCK41443.1 hypothetical protein TH25_23750 [Thalassospira profundimaris]
MYFLVFISFAPAVKPGFWCDVGHAGEMTIKKAMDAQTSTAFMFHRCLEMPGCAEGGGLRLIAGTQFTIILQPEIKAVAAGKAQTQRQLCAIRSQAFTFDTIGRAANLPGGLKGHVVFSLTPKLENGRTAGISASFCRVKVWRPFIPLVHSHWGNCLRLKYRGRYVP